MKFAMAEKFCEKYLEDVVREISQDNLWRKKIFEGQYNDQLLITYKELEELPCLLWTVFSKYGLEFFVSKVQSGPEEAEEGQIIFKFEAKGFPHIIKYVSTSENEI